MFLWTLVGAFAPEIKLARVPAVLLVAVWMALLPSEVGDYEAKFRVRDKRRNDLHKGQIRLGIHVLAHTAVALGPFPLQVKEPGEFYFEWSVAGGKWEKISTLRINQVGAIPNTAVASIASGKNQTDKSVA